MINPTTEDEEGPVLLNNGQEVPLTTLGTCKPHSDSLAKCLINFLTLTYPLVFKHCLHEMP